MDRDDDERFERPGDDRSDDEARFTHEDDTDVAPPRDPRTARPAPAGEPWPDESPTTPARGRPGPGPGEPPAPRVSVVR
jgi:hypothetical protein